MIEFRNTRFAFGEGPDLFCGLNLSFSSGKTTAILGPSGSGKSTIIRLICGLLKPNEGSVIVNGSEVSGPGSVRGVLFPDDTLIPWLTTIENSIFPRVPKKSSDCATRATEYLNALGLGDSLLKLPHELSSGMKKRLEFVRATMADDRFLVGDEPFNGLDFHQRRHLWGEWRRLMKFSHRTGIIVTHDPSEAVALGDRILVISSLVQSFVALDLTIEPGADDGVAELAIVHALENLPRSPGTRSSNDS